MPQEDLYSRFTFHVPGDTTKTAYACGNKLSFCLEQYLQTCENRSQRFHHVRADGLSAASRFSPLALSALTSKFYPVLLQAGDFPALWALCMFMLRRHKCSFLLLPCFVPKEAAVGGQDPAAEWLNMAVAGCKPASCCTHLSHMDMDVWVHLWTYGLVQI